MHECFEFDIDVDTLIIPLEYSQNDSYDPYDLDPNNTEKDQEANNISAYKYISLPEF